MGKKNNMNEAEDRLKRQLLDFFAPATDQMTNAIASFMAARLPDDVLILDFEFFPDTFFSKTLRIMPRPYSHSQGVYTTFMMPEVEIGTLFWADLVDKTVTEPDFIMEDTLARWFHNAWRTAGGSMFPIPSFFTIHDGKSFCLKRAVWIDLWFDKDGNICDGPPDTDGMTESDGFDFAELR